MKRSQKQKPLSNVVQTASVDTSVLEQILALQNGLAGLPDDVRLGEYLAINLALLPEVSVCRVCLGSTTALSGGALPAACLHCKALRASGSETDPLPAGFQCALADQPGVVSRPVRLGKRHFGFLTFHTGAAGSLDGCLPWVDGLANYLALMLENRRQKPRPETGAPDSDTQIKQLIESSPVAMVVSSGPDEKIELINDKFIELFGFTYEDIPDVAHWWPLAYPNEQHRREVRDVWEREINRAIQERGQIEPMEATVTCKDGSHRFIEFRLASIGEKNLVAFIDLTTRKQAELALEEREMHSRSLVRLARQLEQAQTYVDIQNAAQDELRAVIGYQHVWVYLLSDDGKYAYAVFTQEPFESAVPVSARSTTLTIQGDKMIEQIVSTREIVVVEDAQVDERVNKEIVARLGNRTIVNIPIALSETMVGSVGTGSFGDEGVRVPTATELEYLSASSLTGCG